MLQRGTRKEFWQALFHRRRYDDASKTYVSIFTALQVDRAWQPFMAIERAAGNARDFLVIDDGLAILKDRNRSSYKRDVEGLPLARFAGQFRRRRNETIDSTSVMTRRFLFRVGLNLYFVAAAEINSAIGLLSAIEFDVQLEVFELRIVNKLWTMAGADEVAVHDLPLARRIRLIRFPARKVFAIEQLDRLAPLWRAGSFE